MKNTEQERAEMTNAELDAELEMLAEDVPDMPADFHDRWMQAVRAEAAEKAAPEAETQTRGRITAMRKWTRILSVAAVFVFLIGGTMIYRNSRKTSEEPARETAMEAAVAGMEAAQAPDAGMEADMMAMESAEEAADRAADSAPEAMEYAEEEAYSGHAVFTAGNASLKAESKTGEPVSFAAASYEAAPEAAEAEETPLPAAASRPAADAGSREEAEAPADPGVKENSFFQDMGAFLLLALPYLAMLAVPAVIALVLRRRK